MKGTLLLVAMEVYAYSSRGNHETVVTLRLHVNTSSHPDEIWSNAMQLGRSIQQRDAAG